MTITTIPPKKSKYSIEELQDIITSKSAGRVKLLTPTKLSFKGIYHFLCLECDTEFNKTMTNYLKTRPGNSGCPKCGRPPNAPWYMNDEMHQSICVLFQLLPPLDQFSIPYQPMMPSLSRESASRSKSMEFICRASSRVDQLPLALSIS